MKKPSDSLQELFFETIQYTRKNSKLGFEYLDKLIVWIVGFSIAGLSLIATKLTEFNFKTDYFLSKTILILLVISIISGIVFRISFYLYQNILNQIDIYLNTAFSNKEFMEVDSPDLSDETDIYEVIRKLKIDFGEDLSHELEIYKNANDSHKTLILNSLKSHYKKKGEWAKADYQLAISYAKDTLQKAYKIPNKEIEKAFNGEKDGNHKFWGWLTAIGFSLCCLSFITVIIILAVAY